MKPEIHEEAIGKSTHGAFRGGRGGRAGTEQIGTLGDPAGEGWQHPVLLTGIHNCEGNPGREWERLIVATKSSNADGAKGPY